MSTVTPVSEAEFAVLAADATPVLVDFWATWCGPCRQVAPIVEKIAAELGDRVKVVKVDVDANPALAAAHRITSIPTLMVFKGGEPVWRTSGAKPYAALLPEVESAIA